MTDEERIADLLVDWEDRVGRGDEVTAETLCHDCPHLTERLAEAIRELKGVAWMGREPPENVTVSTAPLTPALLVGRYQPLRRVGVGGNGEVWMGFDQKLQRPVAVKRPHVVAPNFTGLDDTLLIEAQRVARLHHAGIVPVHDVDRDGKGYFIVMEFMEGGSLAERMARGRVDVPTCVRTVREIAAALAYAHNEGIVHHDLKPANVLLDRNGKLWLADFGTALTLPRSAHGSHLPGTPAYMSPEQFRGAPGNAASDVYSLGVLLYELLTGHPPFGPAKLSELRDQVLGCLPRAPSVNNPSVPPALDKVVFCCLAKDPSTRYENAAALVAALESLETATVGGSERRNSAQRAGKMVDFAAMSGDSDDDGPGPVTGCAFYVLGLGFALAAIFFFLLGLDASRPTVSPDGSVARDPGWREDAIVYHSVAMLCGIVAVAAIIAGNRITKAIAAGTGVGQWDKKYYESSHPWGHSHRRSRRHHSPGASQRKAPKTTD